MGTSVGSEGSALVMSIGSGVSALVTSIGSGVSALVTSIGSGVSALVMSIGSGVSALVTSIGFLVSDGLGLITGGGVNVTLSVGVVVLPPDSEGVGLLAFELNGDVLLSEFTLGRVVPETGDTGLLSLPSL